ncbi:hypothetical protein T556_09855 [Neisseria gonorrhoeae NG-k51.05]|nr:hypothetical protein T556_09855 [Neisseria gonorrhoeae NG-k51.05]
MFLYSVDAALMSRTKCLLLNRTGFRPSGNKRLFPLQTDGIRRVFK